MQTEDNSGFGPVIYAYTRAQAVEDGEQVDVSTVAKEAGIKFPVYLTRAVWDKYVEVPAGVTGQDEQGRLWDVVWMLRHGLLSAREGQAGLMFGLYVRNDNRKARLVTLRAECGPVDMDKPEPAITVMLLTED